MTIIYFGHGIEVVKATDEEEWYKILRVALENGILLLYNIEELTVACRSSQTEKLYSLVRNYESRPVGSNTSGTDNNGPAI